jgi:urease accessory protein
MSGFAAVGFTAGFIHPLLGLDHQLAMIAVGIWSGQIGGRMIWAAPLGFMTMMAVGGAMGMAGFPFPYVESGIIASIILFGCLIAGAYNPAPWVGATAVGAFALFHGHAHGVEMQTGNSGLWYAIGFVLATGLLHLAGIAFYKLLEWMRHEATTRWIGAGISLTGVVLIFA